MKFIDFSVEYQQEKKRIMQKLEKTNNKNNCSLTGQRIIRRNSRGNQRLLISILSVINKQTKIRTNKILKSKHNTQIHTYSIHTVQSSKKESIHTVSYLYVSDFHFLQPNFICREERKNQAIQYILFNQLKNYVRLKINHDAKIKVGC